MTSGTKRGKCCYHGSWGGENESTKLACKLAQQRISEHKKQNKLINKCSSFSSGGETHGGQVVTSQRHLNLHGPRSPAVRIESFRPAGDHTHTHTHTHGPLTCKLVIGSVQLSGVRQALVTVFRLHFFFLPVCAGMWNCGTQLICLRFSL